MNIISPALSADVQYNKPEQATTDASSTLPAHAERRPTLAA